MLDMSSATTRYAGSTSSSLLEALDNIGKSALYIKHLTIGEPDVSNATVENERDEKHGNEDKTKVTVTIVHNGVPREFKEKLTTTVQALLTRAMEEFGVVGQPNYGLFTAANVELNASQTLKDAGIVDEQKLVLRPRVSGAGDSRQ